jgi:hypothetical protein
MRQCSCEAVGSTMRGGADGDVSWVASDKSSRLPISTFKLALELHGVQADDDEVECMVANMIYRVSRLVSCICRHISCRGTSSASTRARAPHAYPSCRAVAAARHGRLVIPTSILS